MIFFDATGKRWRKIKLSAAGLTALVAVPAVLLGVGVLAYEPSWGQLPVISQARNFVDEAASLATGQVTAATPPPSSSPSASASPGPSSKPVAHVTAKSTASAPAVLSAQATPTPIPHGNPHTSTPIPTPSPSSAPGNSGNAHAKHSPQSHQP